MPNTRSAKKALRGSLKKQQNNTFWKNRIKSSMKTLNRSLDTKSTEVGILNKELSVFQKILDKAAKNKVLHKNKANRLKSRYAKKIAAQTQTSSEEASKGSKSKS